jgi:hypothetical protein
MSTPAPITPVPRRLSIRMPRPLWIGLSAVGLVVVVLGLGIGVPIYRKHVAIRENERLGGRVWTEHSGPAWLRSCIGDEAMKVFDPVVEVALSGTGVTEDTVPVLKDLQGLQVVHLGYLPVDRGGMGGRPTHQDATMMLILKTIPPDDNDRVRVTDAGLEHLKYLKNLSELHLLWTDVTDAGVAELQRALPELKIEK